MSRPYIIKDGLSPVTLKRGSAHAVSKLNCIQVLVPISLISIHIHRNALRKGTIDSLDKTIIWGLYLVVNTLWVFIRKQTSLTKLDRKLEPRFERSVCGSPWRDIIFLTKKVCNNNYLNIRDSKTFHPTGTVKTVTYWFLLVDLMNGPRQSTAQRSPGPTTGRESNGVVCRHLGLFLMAQDSQLST